MNALMATYAPLPVTFSHGTGAYLYDTHDVRYLDGLSGIAVTNLGHAHPAVTEAIREQAGRLLHTSNYYHIAAQERLADTLTRVTGMERAFFCNSGAEANEAAIKLARLYGHQRDIEQPEIIVLEDAFHGRTLATLSATGNRRIQAGFEPLVAGFVRAPRNDMEAVHNIARNNPNVVAVLLEPIQGEGGIRPLDSDYLHALRQFCSEQGWLLMLDEVQSGNGRTGHFFAYQGLNLLPDVVTTAKGLGNGVPIGACLARGTAAGVFAAGHHGSTYGGNPLACAAAQAVVDTLESESLYGKATHLGERVRAALRAEAGDDAIVDLRGRGLMLGIELARPCADIMQRALDAHILLNVTAGNTVRLLPPLIMSDEQADTLGAGVGRVIREFHKAGTAREG
ncbi:aspartate aminotransferase family protein [Chromatocurvus halotolerans]|uniref:Acetylornithine aminotransferase n=1 Tax=Chromatocurvus halotolerans TaxID=1132028 RepID=A0A4V2SBY1_9GAMM|nr:aspartate aminotransferase family protein [Chromatocurvus halotolerans]TCO77270.1 acetylornithine aminotransferase [Chromatocurvus halotolerans]